ncbi:Bug family tripartite tricarboxylate transporter substrate binding protein [Promicromonospora panici]|uniref:Bug family tripartite tricarboxylate transporter substrate binding protein n=1 Tax=Promicromonospora panici TaxID=2219658 RepID=UPI00101DF029|nr:tripartite tricarboxylate transporter substrate binding protein [Promicromonospora panici]
MKKHTNQALSFAVATTALAGLATGCSTSGASADGDCGTITMVVPYAAGGSSDVVGRALADAVSSTEGTRVEVVNQTGANGTVAATQIATERPDPCEVIYLPTGPFASMPYFQDVQFEPADFRGIYAVNEEPIILLVNAASDWQSMADLRADADRRFTYASSGTGSYTQLAVAQTFADLGAEAEGIPFDGSAPAITALLGDQVDAVAVHPGEAMQYLESGDLRAIAVFGDERLESLPDVPTAAEQDVDIELAVAKALYANADIPDEAAAELERIFSAAGESEDVTNTLATLYSEPSSVPTDELVPTLEAEYEENGTTFAELGLIDE